MWGIHLVLFCFSPHSGFGLILSFVSFSPLDLNTLCDTSWSSQIVSQLRPEKEVHENEDEKLFRFSFISAHVQHETWELFSASHIREKLGKFEWWKFTLRRVKLNFNSAHKVSGLIMANCLFAALNNICECARWHRGRFKLDHILSPSSLICTKNLSLQTHNLIVLDTAEQN